MERRESNGERPPPDSVLDRERDTSNQKTVKTQQKIIYIVYTSVVNGGVCAYDVVLSESIAIFRHHHCRW